MIPAFDKSGVLPPFTTTAYSLEGRSPYPVSLAAVRERFAATPTRHSLFEGLLQYRAALRDFGVIEGFQWLGGSFVENVEEIRGRGPHDLDIVTFIRRPRRLENEAEWSIALDNYEELFHAHIAKARFDCDAYCIDLDARPVWLVRQVAYWIGLFSHQRKTERWKGLVQVNLIDPDDCPSHEME